MTKTDDHTAQPDTDFSRRNILRGVAIGGAALPLLAACGGADDAADSGGSGGSSGGAGDSSSSGGSGGAGGSAGATVAKSDVPVGGGTILKKEKIVVTQPTAGDFKAYSAICTHQGCTVGKIEDGEIICPCHMSHFSIKDGSNTQGPNDTAAGSVQPLAGRKVSVKGSQLSIG